jgi:predicted Zn-ribbon and HTH transcriptional regulator
MFSFDARWKAIVTECRRCAAWIDLDGVKPPARCPQCGRVVDQVST